MNQTMTGLTLYLKDKGIDVKEEDASKILELYMRMVISLTVSEGQFTETGLNILFGGKSNLDFSEMTDEGIQSLVNYTIVFNDTIATHKFNNETLTSITSGNNIVTVLDAAHLFINIITSYEKEIILKSDKIANSDYQCCDAFVNHNPDGTCMSISAYLLTYEEGRKDVVYNFVSNCMVDGIPEEVIYL